MLNKDLFHRLFFLRPRPPAPPVAPGLYHAMYERNGSYTRFHLRVDRDGSGMLIANAATATRLSPTGVVIARSLLDGATDESIVRTLASHFRGATPDMMQRDIQRVRDLITRLATPGDSYPILNFEDAALSPYAAQLIAPWQATVPLCPPDQMLPLLRRLWEVGIPHVTVLVPPAPDTDALLQAIERAEDIGMIAGVRGRGGDLHPATLIRDLALAGVDYITVLYASAQADIHDALCGAGDHAAATRVIATTQQYEVCPVSEVPLVETTLPGLPTTFTSLSALGVVDVSVVAIAAPKEITVAADRSGALAASALIQVATQVEERSHAAQVRAIWQPPVLRNPTLLLASQVQTGPRCSGEVAIRVEPYGDVLPSRGAYVSVGNILRDSWETIWQHPAFRAYRERVEAPTRCNVCPGLAICAADCPAELGSWTQGYLAHFDEYGDIYPRMNE